MRGMKAINPFLLIWACYTLVLGVAVMTTEQLELHRAMHSYTSTWSDGFFRMFTHLGDGLVPTGLALSLLMFKDVRSFLLMALSCGLSAIVVQVLKRYFAHDRPFMYKQELGDMSWVEGLELHHHLSFPSGHATASFSMCFALAALIGRRKWSFVLGLAACALAYSRVYLSQHFTEDILFGAALGTATAFVVHWWLHNSPFSHRTWLDGRLIQSK